MVSDALMGWAVERDVLIVHGELPSDAPRGVSEDKTIGQLVFTGNELESGGAQPPQRHTTLVVGR